MISAIIPTLNAEATLARTLECLTASPLIAEVIVADGASTDSTRTLAESHGARVCTTERGRGRQLAAGATHAGQPWLLFLHADTVLAPGWDQAAGTFIAKDRDQAAVFRFALDDRHGSARVLEKIVACRVQLLGLAYGDQGLLISRRFYDRLGGYRPLPLMEDVDLIRRIGRRRLRVLPATAMTSAARYRRDGYLLRSGRNALCLTLYFLGVPPETLERLYR